MLHYIFCNFVKPNAIETTTMHIFEHCFYEKLRVELKKAQINPNGLVFDANTSVDSVFVELYFTDKALTDDILSVIGKLEFSLVNDSDLIEIQKNLVYHEISNIDISEEEQAIYSSIELISEENIMSLYAPESKQRSTQEYVDLFNILISEINMLIYSEGKIEKITNTNLLNSSWKEDSYNTSGIILLDKYLVGSVRASMDSLDKIILYMCVSFILGKHSDSLIYKNLAEKYGLYLAYTLDIHLYNNYCIMFLTEVNDESKMCIKKMEKLKFLDVDKNYILEQIEAFKTFLALQDPLLRSFSKFYLQSMCRSPVDSFHVLDAVSNLNIGDIVHILSTGELHVYQP